VDLEDAMHDSRSDTAATPWLLRPFQAFFRLEAAGGILLFACAILALIWANSPFAEGYFHLWETTVTVGGGAAVLSKSLHHWINDGLMAIFFFVVGLEIKREILVGELASPKKAALPMAAAVGGMLVPALLYAALNFGKPGITGWGIPMATDIAFALGVLTVLGKRVPLSLKIFLTALAIVDDLGAVLVIAIFYTAELSLYSLGIGFAFLGALIALNRSGARGTLPYLILGFGLWVAFLKSGVHATIAGVLMAMTIPASRKIDAPAFLDRGKKLLSSFASDTMPGVADPSSEQRHAVHALELACNDIQTPLLRMEHALHPWVAFMIMPIFALSNAGVSLGGNLGEAFTNPVTLGVILGLVLGKQIGVTLFAWIAVRIGLAEIPADVTWAKVYGVSWLCGIGFTMSLFVANLAFTDPVLLDDGKIGIMTASLISGVVGYVLLARGKPARAPSVKRAEPLATTTV